MAHNAEGLIQENKRLAESLERSNRLLLKANEELKKATRAKSKFMSDMSHELRTRLNVIIGFSELMLDEVPGKINEDQRQCLNDVLSSGKRLLELINDALDLSRIESGEMELKLRNFSLQVVIESLRRVMMPMLAPKKQTLEIEMEKGLSTVYADRDKIRQAILNIIDNAIRYTNHGGVTVKIRNLKSKIQIVVSDTGEGMTKEEISHLFESFSRGTAGTRFWTEGAGLGLYIAKRFIDMNKGKIWAESKGKGKGSTFYIELPIK